MLLETYRSSFYKVLSIFVSNNSCLKSNKIRHFFILFIKIYCLIAWLLVICYLDWISEKMKTSSAKRIDIETEIFLYGVPIITLVQLRSISYTFPTLFA